MILFVWSPPQTWLVFFVLLCCSCRFYLSLNTGLCPWSFYIICMCFIRGEGGLLVIFLILQFCSQGEACWPMCWLCNIVHGGCACGVWEHFPGFNRGAADLPPAGLFTILSTGVCAVAAPEIFVSFIRMGVSYFPWGARWPPLWPRQNVIHFYKRPIK